MTDTTPSAWRRKTAIPGLILCRIIVPLWILTGALFKLIDANPGLLPKGILVVAHQAKLNLDHTLATLIALEFFALLVIALVGRVARAMAIFMLSCFCLILLREIVAGNADCGCLGAHSPSPWTMLWIDGALLVGVVLLRPARFPVIDSSRWSPVIAAVLVVAAAAFTFVRLV